MSRSPHGYQPDFMFGVIILVLALLLLLFGCRKPPRHRPTSRQTSTADTYNLLVGWDASQDQRASGYKMHLRSAIATEQLVDAGATTVGVVPNVLLGVPYQLSLSAYSAAGDSSAETNPVVFILSGDGQLPTPLRNVSTRAFVQTGDRVVIGGFIVAQRGKFLIRGLGPSLVAFGITDPLLDPKVDLYSKQTLLGSNDDWTTNQADLTAAVPSLLPGNPKEAAMLVTLDPGDYTAILSGANNTSGTGLVEVYFIP